MTNTVLYKKVYQSYLVQQNSDRSQIPNNRAEDFDGKHPFFELVGVFKKEEDFKKNIKDQLYSVYQDTLTVVIEENGHKISIKIFERVFSRQSGRPYFQLKKNLRFMTINRDKGNIYFGEILNYQNKKKFTKKIRCNSFINDSFRVFSSYLKNSISHHEVDKSSEFAIEACRIFLDKTDGGVSGITFGQRLFKFYLDKKNIKYPNNFNLYSELFSQDFKKSLKKFDYKIVDAFMSRNKLQGKKVKKILHTVTNLNLENYLSGSRLFNSNWLNQDEQLLREIFDNSISFHVDDNTADNFVKFSSLKEKKKAFNLYKTFNHLNEIDGWTLVDHFRFFTELKRYGDTEIEWKSDGIDSKKFREEHLDWADKLTFYKRGNYERIYDENFLNKIKQFECGYTKYFPIILTNSSEYNEESSTQSNCVRGYIGRPSSLIISLRKDFQDSEERLTVEYRIHLLKNSDVVHLDRIQTRLRYNYPPNESWTNPLEILDTMVNNSGFKNYKLKKKCLNGVELESDTEFNEDGFLIWTFRAIENSDIFYNIL